MAFKIIWPRQARDDLRDIVTSLMPDVNWKPKPFFRPARGAAARLHIFLENEENGI